MSTRRTALRRLALGSAAAFTAAVLLGAGLTPSPTPAYAVSSEPAQLQPRNESVVTADPLPTVQIDAGYVWAQAVSGSTVYAVGDFDGARPPLAEPGTRVTPRTNALAFDITTGAMNAWAPVVNGAVKAVAVSPDGKRVYIGGSFTEVNGERRYNFAALDAKTGQLVSGFNPSVGGSGVFGIATTAETVYLTGLFTQANGVARKNNAAFAASNGALRSWAPSTDRQGDAILVEPGTGQIVLGGRFYKTNDVVQRGLANVDPVSGALNTNWAVPKTVQNGWSEGASAGKAGIFALAADDSAVYGTGWVYANAAVGNLEGTFAAEAGSGDVRWVADCHGDHYGVFSTGETVYTTGHTHECDTMGLQPELIPRSYRYTEAYTASAEGTLSRSPSAGSAYKDWSGTPSPAPYEWFPDFTVGKETGLGQAGLSITGTGDIISIAGEFGSVNNKRFQGIVRFSTKPPNGPKEGPRLRGDSWSPPSASSRLPGAARISVRGNWDRDSSELTYELLREGASRPIATKKVKSTWWEQPMVTFDDTAVTAGQTYTYTVRVTDADGNAVTSSPSSVKIRSEAASPYAEAVLQDGAELYYPLGSDTADAAGGDTPIFGTGVTATQLGAVAGETGTSASTFDGGNEGRVTSSQRLSQPGEQSSELWFKTTSTQGGILLSNANTQQQASNRQDRQLYLSSDGKVNFALRPASGVKSIQSPAAYNDGKWHHVVTTLGPGGITLSVDGKQVARDTTATNTREVTGWWRIGSDTISGLPSQPAAALFKGSIDEVAVYNRTLSAAQIKTHYALGRGETAPSASFTSTTNELEASFDGSASKSPAGTTIDRYEWNFGDGSAVATGKTAKRTYAKAGTYTVTLTITDSRGLTDTERRDVKVEGPNVAPKASFTAKVESQAVAVDGSASTDSDGTIASYSWNWGDRTAAGSGKTASHSYAKAGTYSVALTVTGNRGGKNTSSKTITIAPQNVVASDTFERSVTGGWGSVSTGGAWTMQESGSSPASVASGQGRLTLPAKGSRIMSLRGVNAADVRASVDISLDAAPSTGGSYVGVVARQSASGDYRVRAWMRDNGTVWLVLQKGGTVLKTAEVPGVVRAAGDTFTLEVQVTGASGATTLEASLWKKGAQRPAGWQVSFTDSEAGSASGSIGLHAARASTATSTGVFTFDNFQALELE